MDESQNNYAEWKKQDKKNTYCLITFIYTLRKCKLIFRNRKQTVVAWRQSRRGQGGLGGGGITKALGGDGFVQYLDVVMVSWMCACTFQNESISNYMWGWMFTRLDCD